jgi:hypothetical protein
MARKTKFGACMSRKLKGKKYRSASTAHKALGKAARGCALKRGRKRSSAGARGITSRVKGWASWGH